MKKTTLQRLIEKLRLPFNTEELGSFQRKMSNKIDIYTSSIEGIKHVIIFYRDDKDIEKINFVYDTPMWSIDDLTKELGEFKSGYSFRDDLTKVSFNKPIGLIQKITTKKDNKIDISIEGITQTTPQGVVSKYNSDDKIFSSVCFLF